MNFIENTPINKIKLDLNKNSFYIKRDDLIPFSFGGNKVRIAKKYLEDMQKKGCNCMISYGDSKSNLCRVISNLCVANNIECIVISSIEENAIYEESNNSILVKFNKGKVVTCKKTEVAETIEKVKEQCIRENKKPYYIYDIENLKVTINAYSEAYQEIKEYEKKVKLQFDYIFFASGTGMTQAGLLLGRHNNNDTKKKIVGISIARKKEVGIRKIEEILQANNIRDEEIIFEDKYTLGKYGEYNDEIENIIKEQMKNNSIPLDTTYTGKAFWGMKNYIKEHNITNKNILFIHTGGLPLFFDKIQIFKENN